MWVTKLSMCLFLLYKKALFFVTFLACPRKVTQRRAPGENSLRHARSSSVHFGNSLHSRMALVNAGRRLANLRAQTVRNASPSDSVAWLNFRMGPARNFDSNLHPKPRTSLEQTYALHSRWRTRRRWVQAVHRVRPAGRSLRPSRVPKNFTCTQRSRV